MTFGLTNILAFFERLMNKIFHKEFNISILFNSDCILVFYRFSVLGSLTDSVTTTDDAKLYGQLHKWELLKDGIEYLSLEISAEGVHTSLEKVKVVVEWPSLGSMKDNRSLFGIALYYRENFMVF